MDERNFRIWLEQKQTYHTARTYASRCIRVEETLRCDLDEEYEKDSGKELMNSLKYSRREEREGKLPKCGIDFGDKTNVYTGMHTIRASVKKYFEYLKVIG